MSRATIYRYFSNADEIAWAVMSDRLEFDTLDEVRDAGPGLVQRMLTAERVVDDYLFANADGARRWEVGTLQRKLDGHGYDEDRPTRRLRFIDTALEHGAEGVDHERVEMLRDALTMVIGTEAMISLLDSARLPEERARAVQRWAVQVLVEAALRPPGAGAPGGGG